MCSLEDGGSEEGDAPAGGLLQSWDETWRLEYGYLARSRPQYISGPLELRSRWLHSLSQVEGGKYTTGHPLPV